MHFTTPVRSREACGFSLVELLLTMTIIGILGGITISAFGDQNDVFHRAKDQRNAQEVVSEFVAGQVAGVTFAVPGDKMATIENVVSGGVAPEGAFEGRRFGGIQLNAKNVLSAATHIAADSDGWLTYQPID